MAVAVRRIRGVALAVMPRGGAADPRGLNLQWRGESAILRPEDLWSAKAELARVHGDFWPATMTRESKRYRVTIPEDPVRLGLAPKPGALAVVLAHSGWLEIWQEDRWEAERTAADVISIADAASKEPIFRSPPSED